MKEGRRGGAQKKRKREREIVGLNFCYAEHLPTPNPQRMRSEEKGREYRKERRE